MAFYVQKFGGTSVGGIDRMDAVAARIAADWNAGHEIVVVVSAMAGETDRLLRLARAVSTHGRPNPRELDVLLATGEQVSIALLCMALEKQGITAVSFTGWQAGIRTDARFSQATITDINTRAIKQALAQGRLPVVAGFQGVTETLEISTIGRGGSDTTAVALAAALDADECQIFTDVDGVYTADPRQVERAHRLDEIDFDSMALMAAHGSKVLQIHSVEIARDRNVTLRVLSAFEPGAGTQINGGVRPRGVLVRGIACQKDRALLGLDGSGNTEEIRNLLVNMRVPAEFLGQKVANDGVLGFNLAVPDGDFEHAKEIIEAMPAASGVTVSAHRRVAVISLIGSNLSNNDGFSGRLAKVTGSASGNCRWIGVREKCVSLVVDDEFADEWANRLHDEFCL